MTFSSMLGLQGVNTDWLTSHYSVEEGLTYLNPVKLDLKNVCLPEIDGFGCFDSFPSMMQLFEGL